MAYQTAFGSLDSYEKGTIELNDDLKHYAFSNIFEVAGKSQPFERPAVLGVGDEEVCDDVGEGLVVLAVD